MSSGFFPFVIFSSAYSLFFTYLFIFFMMIRVLCGENICVQIIAWSEGVFYFHGNLRMPSRKIIITDKRTSDSLVSCFLGRKKNTVSRGMFTIS